MTNELSVEEAIELLKDKRMEINYKVNGTTQFSEALDMAIKALGIASCIKEKCAYCPHCENCDVDDDTLEIKALEQQPIDKSAMMYEIYMEGVNMSGEYQGCWVRFKNIEKIVDKYIEGSESE